MGLYVSIEAGVVYVVATPIGNLGDMTRRAREVLAGVDCIAAEDTRHSRCLLTHLGIDTPMVSLHEHNERQQAARLLQTVAEGASLALISDAGTPLLSDPGFYLVREARRRGVRVVPVPGPSALIAALSVAGLPTDRFVFEGFLPARSAARGRRLEQLATESRTLVFYESSHRIEDSLGAMAAIFGGERQAVLARELTKTFETVHGDTLARLCAWLAADANRRKGEFVVLVHGAEVEADPETGRETDRILGILLQHLPLRQAVGLAVQITGGKKNALYQRAIALQGKD